MVELETRRSGATDLRPLTSGTPEYRRWLDIVAEAYPILKRVTAAQRDAAFEEQRDLEQREPEHRVVGAYRNGVLVGGMRMYDFTMCVRGAQVFTGGLGSVAVGLEHKRRGIARDLVAGYLNEYRARGAALGVLYPFRPDFYGRLGFGFGAKINRYRFALDALPTDGVRERVRILGPDDDEALLATYNRVQQHTNGLIRRERRPPVTREAGAHVLTFGYAEGAALAGYLAAEVRLGKAPQTNRNDLFVHELVYETPAALAGLLAFAASQRDQFAALIVHTHDPDFHFAVCDPRNGSDRNLFPPVYHETNTQGIGVMYRALDAAALVRALAGQAFGELDATVRIGLTDAFLPPNNGVLTIRFRRGRPHIAAAGASADVDLAIGVAEFSSLVMGAVRLRSLVAYERAALSDLVWLDRLDAAFDTLAPHCLTRF
jgi:predicted acetyltransferase